MINPIFLNLKKYLTLDEAAEYIAHNFSKDKADQKEILFLINEGFISCFLDCQLETTDNSLFTEYIEKNKHYEGCSIGLQKLINPIVNFSNGKKDFYNGSCYYLDTDEINLIGDFLAVNELTLNGLSALKPQQFQQVLQTALRYENDFKKNLLKVEFEELKRILKQLPTEDLIYIGDNAQTQKAQQKIIETLQSENKILKKQLENTPTHSVYTIVGALIEILTEQKIPRRNQARIKDELEDKELKGLSRGNLNNVFAAANKALETSKDEV